jgi:putative methionine-R-sulfoxide reductase with GAF domain
LDYQHKEGIFLVTKDSRRVVKFVLLKPCCLLSVVDTADRLRERLATLRAVGHALARPLDVVDVLRATHTEMASVLDATICFFGVFDHAGQSVDVIWQMHEGTELPGGSFPLGRGPTSEAIRQRQPQLIRRWSAHGPRVQLQYATDRPGLPESSIVAPVMFADDVIGVLVVQSYRPDAYDEDDLALLQDIADRVAVAVAGALSAKYRTNGSVHGTDVEPVLASMPDALLVLDENGCVVRLNPAARRLLTRIDASLIMGHPVDRPQADQWPLGSRALTEQLGPIVDQLKRGKAPKREIEVALDHGRAHRLSCRASVLRNHGAPAGGVLILRDVA